MHTPDTPPIRIAIAGLGKMGLSHQALVNAHPHLELVAVCDPATYLLDIIGRCTGVATYSDYARMLERERLDAVLVATPSRLHARMVHAALEHGLDVFCEKPFCLDVEEGARLVALAAARGAVTQVGYHNRFLGTFEEVRRLLDVDVIGRVHHARVDCYGPVVLRPKGATWRSSRNEGGGCLYDYACHGIDLLNFTVGPPTGVSGSILSSVFSASADDEVYANLSYADGKTAQLSANWSDDSHRKMSTTLVLWGTNGKIEASRQELHIHLRTPVAARPDLSAGWNVRYTTDLTRPVWFYLRGEEYSAQIDYFAESIRQRRVDSHCGLAAGLATDIVADMIRRDAASAAGARADTVTGAATDLASAGGVPGRWGRLRDAVLSSPETIMKALKGSP
ncbi:Gfo/Idh/MocA family protein [Massilia oculi]|uniref:Oxidoreductase n=1 Tax=Massilia oculi TaxID=945844 RepID=A0A2S2DP80_9BURK|nr:Gfo/Idh/MocA family oxidoreductase [Massilia oculi]AWL07174.1 oxidoreductase [Massilia oculi]